MRLQEAIAAPGVAPGAQAPVQTQPEGLQTHQRAGGYGPGRAGVAQAAIRAGLGAKQFFGGLDEQDRAVLREMEAEADQEQGSDRFWRGAGDLAGNVAMTAVPGAAVARGVNAAAKVVPAATRMLPLAAGAVSSGVTEGVVAPGEGETFSDQMLSKAKEAAKAAGWGGAFTLGGKLAKKAVVNPFRAKPEAEMLFRQGVNPTLQQGAEGKFGRWIGGLSSGATEVRKRQEEEVADALLRRVTEGKVEATGGTGRDYFQAAKDYVSGQYDNLMAGKKFPISPSTRSDVAEAASALNKQGQFAKDAQIASSQVSNIMGDSATNINVGHRRLREDFLTPLSKAAYAGNNTDEIRRRILAARQVLIDKARTTRLTPEEQARLAELDRLHFDVSRLREATQGAAGEAEGIGVNRLSTAYGSMSDAAKKVGNTTEAELVGPAARILGRMPRQDESRTLYAQVKRAAAPVLGPGLITAAATPGGFVPGVVLGGGMYGLSLAGQTKTGARVLLGQTGTQKKIAELLRKKDRLGNAAADYLYPMGSAWNDQEE